MDSQVTTQMLRLFNLESIHIELSSKCTLKCPRCPRTELDQDSLNREFSLAQFQSAFPISLLKNSVKKILFCGDIGDPIYATQFLQIIKYIKSNTWTTVEIVTNGSYKKPEWWTELGLMLTAYDKVTFSVDGWDQGSNNRYRVNSDWDSIIEGIRALRATGPVRINWSTIYFNFNEDKMRDIMLIAKDLKVDGFQTVKSSKFDGSYAVDEVDLLKPSDANVSSTSQYEKTTTPLRRMQEIKIVKNNPLGHTWAKCMRWEKELFINVDGIVHPCPWFNSGYYYNDFIDKYRDRLSVKNRSLSEVLTDELWDEFITRIETMPLDVCKVKCRDCK
jgi:MoaA/NifB/PqqE/SkfB family radical SAM enzyme